MLSERIKKRRALLRLSQSELARRIGKTPNYICQLEKNHLTPSLKSLDKIAQALNTKAGLLLDENSSPMWQNKKPNDEYINKLLVILNKRDRQSKDLIKKVIDFLISKK